MAAADVTYKETGITKSVVWDWASNGAGAYSQITSKVIDGTISRAVFVPDGGGTAPSDLYDVTITDNRGIDILLGLGANRSGTSTNNLYNMSLEVHSPLTLVVANAGDTKGGVVELYYQ